VQRVSKRAYGLYARFGATLKTDRQANLRDSEKTGTAVKFIFAEALITKKKPTGA